MERAATPVLTPTSPRRRSRSESQTNRMAATTTRPDTDVATIFAMVECVGDARKSIARGV